MVHLLYVASIQNSPDSSGMNAQALASQNLAAFIGTDSGTFQCDEVPKLSLPISQELNRTINH